MGDYMVLPPPDPATRGNCCNCGDPALLVYTTKDGKRWRVCSDGCLIALFQPGDRDIAGIITPEEMAEMQAV